MKTIALHSDGTCSVIWKDDYSKTNYSTSDWSNIVQIDASRYNIAGLRSDGTVVSSGNNERGQQNNVSSFKNIKQLAMGTWKIMGLTQDGQIMFSGWNGHGEADVQSWTGIKKIINGGSFYSVGLKINGTVIGTPSGNEKWTAPSFSGWRDIVDIVCYEAGDLVAGLKKDGTVVIAGNDVDKLKEAGYEHLTDDWEDVIYIYPGAGGIVGLKSDGTLLYIGTSKYVDQATVAGWHLW